MEHLNASIWLWHLSYFKRGVKKKIEYNFLPATCGFSRLRDAVLAARSSCDTDPLIVVLFHQYDFKQVDKRRGKITCQEFANLLNWLKAQKDIRLQSIDQVAEALKE